MWRWRDCHGGARGTARGANCTTANGATTHSATHGATTGCPANLNTAHRSAARRTGQVTSNHAGHLRPARAA